MKNIQIMSCEGCGKTYVPPAYICGPCQGEESGFSEKEIPAKGSVVSFSTVWIAPKILEDVAPYTIAIVELEDGPRLLGRFSGRPPENVSIGTQVEVDKGEMGEFLLKKL